MMVGISRQWGKAGLPDLCMDYILSGQILGDGLAATLLAGMCRYGDGISWGVSTSVSISTSPGNMGQVSLEPHLGFLSDLDP